ncbi:MAG: energy transducer TonB [Flavobacteriales bacterium]
MITRILLLALLAWACPASAQFPMLQPVLSESPQCGQMIEEAREALQNGDAELAIKLTTFCIDSTKEQWAFYVRARARLFLSDTVGYCKDMQDTWELPEERKLEFTAICTVKDSGSFSQAGMDTAHFPGVKTVSKELQRADSVQVFRLYDDRDTLLAVFSVRNGDTLYSVASIAPEFEGAQGRFNPWLMKQIKYPNMEFDAGIQGTVYVRFTVNEQGQVLDPEILRSPSEGFSEEVLRVMAFMPPWTPARAFGRTVRSILTLPVIFRLR